MKVKVQTSLLEDTINHLIMGNMVDFAEGINRIMGDTFSYFDTANQPEKVYQAWVMGLLAIKRDFYTIRSNRESGTGRYDVAMIPHDRTKVGIIMELKQIPIKADESADDRQGRIDALKAQALQQINAHAYHKELVDLGITDIRKIPMVFVGKEVFV